MQQFKRIFNLTELQNNVKKEMKLNKICYIKHDQHVTQEERENKMKVIFVEKQ